MLLPLHIGMLNKIFEKLRRMANNDFLWRTDVQPQKTLCLKRGGKKAGGGGGGWRKKEKLGNMKQFSQ